MTHGFIFIANRTNPQEVNSHIIFCRFHGKATLLRGGEFHFSCTVDKQEASTFNENFANISESITSQRLSISGVDEDEEALDLVKFQNAYNLSSQMVQVMTEMYDQLILQTGV